MPPKKKVKKDTKKEIEAKKKAEAKKKEEEEEEAKMEVEEPKEEEKAKKKEDDKKEVAADKKEEDSKKDDAEETEEEKEDDDDDKKTKANKKEEKSDEEDEEDSEEESEEDESTDDEDRGRGKRKRKSSLNSSFQPEDFTEREVIPASARIIKGRGEKLGDIPEVKASIEKHKTNSAMMLSAHKFLFSMRGHPARKDVKKNLLDFSGYLKELPKNYDEKHQEKEDEDIETVFSKKAYKMTTAQLKSMIDFFSIDRFSESPGGNADKETLVDYLLDFLGAPDPDLVLTPGNVPAKKKKKSPKKKKPKRVAPKKPVDPFEDVRSHKKGEKPSDAALRQWVRAYVVCFDMDQATTKHAITTATERFGIDMAKKKSAIKHLLTEEMQICQFRSPLD